MENLIKVNDELIALAKIFKRSGASLYIVGGYVRNALLGFSETDIDICSNLLPEEVFKLLYNSDFECVLINEKLGTIHISNKNGGEIYEHTTFRAEVYAEGGAHSPTAIQFVTEIQKDASRRDFSCNALYYDVLDNKILDFYNGVSDTKNYCLKTIETAKQVFSCDGLRILRMIRIASELDFSIDEETFNVAKSLVHQLKDISQERFNKEIIAMLYADFKYEAVENSSAHIRALKLLGELGAWKYILKSLWASLTLEQKNAVSDINWDLLQFAPAVLRISAFTCCILDSLKLDVTINNVFNLLGVNGLMLNKKECNKQFKIAYAYFYIKNNSTNEQEMRLFIQQNSDYLEEVFALCKLGNCGQNYIKLYELMQLDKTPFSIKDLAINGNDLQETYPELPKNCYSQVLSVLLQNCAIAPELNKKDNLLFVIPDVFLNIKNH